MLHFSLNPTEGAVYVSIRLKSKVQVYFLTFSPFLTVNVTSAQIWPVWTVAGHECEV